MVEGCNRKMLPSEIMYTIPWLPFGHERGLSEYPNSVGKLYTSRAGSLSASFCGILYSNARGIWLCEACAQKHGYLW